MRKQITLVIDDFVAYVNEKDRITAKCVYFLHAPIRVILILNNKYSLFFLTSELQLERVFSFMDK